MRIERFGCGGSSDGFFQREHSGGLFCHHCKICRRAATKKSSQRSCRPIEDSSAGQQPEQGTNQAGPDPCQAFELTLKALLQIIRNCKYGRRSPDLLALFCDSHATQKPHARRRAISNRPMQKR
jgi:hypothetical protein